MLSNRKAKLKEAINTLEKHLIHLRDEEVQLEIKSAESGLGFDDDELPDVETFDDQELDFDPNRSMKSSINTDRLKAIEVEYKKIEDEIKIKKTNLAKLEATLPDEKTRILEDLWDASEAYINSLHADLSAALTALPLPTRNKYLAIPPHDEDDILIKVEKAGKEHLISAKKLIQTPKVTDFKNAVNNPEFPDFKSKNDKELLTKLKHALKVYSLINDYAVGEITLLVTKKQIDNLAGDSEMKAQLSVQRHFTTKVINTASKLFKYEEEKATGEKFFNSIEKAKNGLDTCMRAKSAIQVKRSLPMKIPSSNKPSTRR